MQANVDRIAMAAGQLLRIVLACCLAALATAAPADDINKVLTDLAASDAFSGAVAIVVNGEMVLSGGYGLADREHGIPVSADTVFQIGSIAKQFTAAAVLLLQERGKLATADTVGRYLPELPADWQPLTIHQLLNHTAGLNHPWNLDGFEDTMAMPRDRKQVLALYEDHPLISDAGAEFHYSDHGYFLLALIIEKVSGQDYHQFLREALLEPLGMRQSGGDRQDMVIPGRASGYARQDGIITNSPPIYMPTLMGSGDLSSTVKDLVRWHAGLKSGVLLTEKSLERMITPGLGNYGYGWRIQTHNGIRMAMHTGGTPGFKSLIMRFPELDSCIIVLSNRAATRFDPILDVAVERVVASALQDRDIDPKSQ